MSKPEIRFEKCREEDGASLYNLVVHGKIIERDLDIQQVVERISRSDVDLGLQHTHHIPEDDRRPMLRR